MFHILAYSDEAPGLPIKSKDHDETQQAQQLAPQQRYGSQTDMVDTWRRNLTQTAWETFSNVSVAYPCANAGQPILFPAQLEPLARLPW